MAQWMLRWEQMPKKVNLTGLALSELLDFVATLGEPTYRARQIFGALHNRR
jgi:adenine C2-methylase RlmN of 23S rRNA A2503 and tRNA A37